MKFTIIASIIAVVLIVGALIMREGPDTDNFVSGSNVSIVDGKQIIDVLAKGGFAPYKSYAKAGIPTILRMNTRSTFDCSSVLLISSLNIKMNLPPSGKTEIDLGIPGVGFIGGSCGMGMYFFKIEFES